MDPPPTAAGNLTAPVMGPVTRRPTVRRIDFPGDFLGTMPRAQAWVLQRGGLIGFGDACLRGVGQVNFCNSPLSGLVFLVATFVMSPYLGTFALVGMLFSTATAYLLRLNPNSIASGLLGYNGVLASVGVGLFTFGDDHNWGLAPQAWTAAAFVAAVSALIATAVGAITVPTWKLPPLTLPFQLATWLWLLAMQSGHYFPIDGTILQPHLNSYPTAFPASLQVPAFPAKKLPEALFGGVSQVFFDTSVAGGVLYLVGILICTRIGAFMALLGSAIGLCVSLALGMDPATAAAGLMGYNAVLTTMAIGGFFVVLSGWRSFIFTVFASAVTAVVTMSVSMAFAPFGMPPLTFPFVLTSWTFILVAKQSTGFVLVDLASLTTPEEHRKRFAHVAPESLA